MNSQLIELLGKVVVDLKSKYYFVFDLLDRVRKVINRHEKVKLYYPILSNISPNAEIGAGTTIHTHCWIGDVKIGTNVKIQAFAFIPEGVTIGHNVFIGPHVCFTNDKNPPSDRKEWGKTIVEDGAVIGANATILPGITIGRNAKVGAGAVDTKDVTTKQFWVGNPATRI